MKRVEWDVLRKAEGAVLVYVYEFSRKLLTGGYDVTYEYRASGLPHSASNLAPARPRLESRDTTRDSKEAAYLRHASNQAGPEPLRLGDDRLPFSVVGLFLTLLHDTALTTRIQRELFAR